HGAAFDGVQDAVDLALVGDAVLAILERLELGDVGAGREGLVAGAGDDQGLDLTGLTDAGADLGQTFIHREGKGIARLRPVEGDPADLATLVVEQFLGHFALLPGWAGHGRRDVMALERLLKGFKDFRTGYYREHHDLFEKLATEGQSPKILIIGCADARVDPGILTQTKPGDIFTVRNVAAMVPPAQFPPDTRHHGTSSAIEFAVRGLGVEHVVVLGHALCGGIGALVDGRDSIYASYDYLSTWTSIAQEVRDLAVAKLKGRSREEIARAVEQAAVLNSV